MEFKLLIDSAEVPLNRWLTLYCAIVENEFLTEVSVDRPQRQTFEQISKQVKGIGSISEEIV